MTRTITTTAQNLLSSQLPPLPVTQLQGASAYPDQATFTSSDNAQGVRSTRSDKLTIIPTQAGELTLPAVTLSWWDTATDTQREAMIPAVTLTVQSALGASPASLPATTTETATIVTDDVTATAATDHRWLLVSIVLLLLWLCTLYGYLRLKGVFNKPSGNNKQTNKEDKKLRSERQAFKQLQQACQHNDPQQTRDPLLQWAKIYWPETDIHSLQDIGIQCPALAESLRVLDGVLYGGEDKDWQANTLLTTIVSVRRQQKSKPEDKPSLPPLYAKDSGKKTEDR